MNNMRPDKHKPITIVQLLDFRKAAKLQLAKRILGMFSSIGTEKTPELQAFLFPDVGCAVLTAIAGSLMSADMRLFYMASHLADAFTIETDETNNVCFSLVFKDMFLPISCEVELSRKVEPENIQKRYGCEICRRSGA